MRLVLFLHSTGAPTLWSGYGADLAGRERLAPVNLGYSPGPPLARGAPWTLDADAAHVLAQVPTAATAIDVVAHSYGGVLATRVLPELAGRVQSLFLYEPVLFGALATDAEAPEDAVLEARTFLEHPWFLRDDARGGGEEWLEHFIDYWNRPGSWRRMPEPLREMTRAFGWKMYQEVRACFESVHRFDDLALDVPTTLVMGGRSPRTSRAMVEAIGRRARDARIVELEGLGHMGPLSAPDPVKLALAAHLARATA